MEAVKNLPAKIKELPTHELMTAQAFRFTSGPHSGKTIVFAGPAMGTRGEKFLLLLKNEAILQKLVIGFDDFSFLNVQAVSFLPQEGHILILAVVAVSGAAGGSTSDEAFIARLSNDRKLVAEKKLIDEASAKDLDTIKALRALVTGKPLPVDCRNKAEEIARDLSRKAPKAREEDLQGTALPTEIQGDKATVYIRNKGAWNTFTLKLKKDCSLEKVLEQDIPR